LVHINEQLFVEPLIEAIDTIQHNINVFDNLIPPSYDFHPQRVWFFGILGDGVHPLCRLASSINGHQWKCPQCPLSQSARDGECCYEWMELKNACKTDTATHTHIDDLIDRLIHEVSCLGVVL